MLNRDWIAAHIPHQGNMCLLSEVTHWDTQEIHCSADSHRDLNHPLRLDGRLGIAVGIEYAAQAMAVHGALLANSDAPPRPGYLGSVRGIQASVQRLDDLPGVLEITAQRLSGDDKIILYRFALIHQQRCILQGRASVVVNVSGL